MDKDQLPSWSDGMKRDLMIVILLSGILLAGILFIRRSLIRSCTMTAIVVATVAGVWFVLSRLEEDPLVSHEGQLLIIKCRNSCTAKLSPGDGAPVPDVAPVYCAPWQMEEDQMVIDSVEGIIIPLNPDIVRVFRKTGDAPG